MMQSILRVVSTTVLAVLMTAAATTASAETADAPVYQIVRATDSQVWRLNTRTGEIAVCSLEGEQMLCTSSEQAATPPAKSYAEIEAERAEQQQLAAERREEKRRRSAAMLDLMLNTFRTIASAAPASGDTN